MLRKEGEDTTKKMVNMQVPGNDKMGKAQGEYVGLEYLHTYRVASTHDLNAILFPPSSEHTVRCIAV